MPSKLRVVTTAAKFPKDASFDPPEHYTLKDRPGVPGRCSEFFAYWKRIAGTASNADPRSDLIEVRWYIHKPKILLTLLDPTLKYNYLTMLTGPLWFEDPEDYLVEVPKRLGSGAWHVCINEAGIKNALAECYFEAGNYDEYPPQIDLRTLLVDDPVNSDYKRWLAAKGIRTPWDNPEEEDEMAGSAADIVKVALDTVKETSATAVEATREAAKLQVEAAEERAQRAEEEAEEAAEEAEQRGAVEASVEAHAVKASIDMLAHAGTKAVDMITAHAGSQYDPIILMKTAAELTRPQGDSSVSLLVEAIKDSNTKMQQMQERTLEFVQGVVGIRKQPDGSFSSPQTVNPGTSFETELTRFRTLADLLGFKRPDHVEVTQTVPAAPPKPSFWDGIAENPMQFMTMLTTVVTLGANIVYNMMAPKQEKISPQEAMQKAAPPPPVPQPQQAQQPQQRYPASDIRAWANFPRDIEKNFVAHFFGADSNCSGITFAEWILSNGTTGVPNEAGRKLYNSIKSNLGPDKFHQLISSYAPIWDQVKDDQARYKQFVTELFSYDEIKASEANGKAA
jgi:hypothetical protein